MTETTLPTRTFDFGDGYGPVPAIQRENGAWCALSARIAPSAAIGSYAEIGGGAKIGSGAKIGNDAKIGSYAEIGGGAKIGNYAEIGSGAKIGNYAEIGSGAKIGSYAEIGNDAKIGSGAKIGNDADLIRVGPIGSRNDTLHVYPLKDGTLACSTGCFVQHTLAELLAACKETHGPDSPHMRDYIILAAAAFRVLAARRGLAAQTTDDDATGARG